MEIGKVPEALASVAELVQRPPLHREVAGSSVGQGTCLGCRLDP